MNKKIRFGILLLLAALLLTGCSMPTVDELYCLPKRVDVDSNLQQVMDDAMTGLQYSAPISGDNRQTVQTADLDGDGVDEYLLFAQSNGERPLKILIFSQLAAGYALMDTIEGYGFAFEFVDYANVDDRPGLEIIVGRQVSNQVVRAVSVYRFTSGFSRQLMTATYSRLLIDDIDQDGLENLILLGPGQNEDSNATAVLYGFQNGQMQRSMEMELSAPVTELKRISLGLLEDRTPAVYVTSTKDEQTLVSDVLVADAGQMRNVVHGMETAALRNYYIYPEDIDSDGVAELPTLQKISHAGEEDQYLIRWSSVSADGTEVYKLHTYHNYPEGWYLKIQSEWCSRLRVEHTEDMYQFSLMQPGENLALFTVMVLSGPDREEQLNQDGVVLLYQADTVAYAAILGEYGASLPIEESELRSYFRLIRMDWNADEMWGNKDEESIDS